MTKEEKESCLGDIIDESEQALDAIGRLNFAYVNLSQVSKGSRQYQTFFREVFDSINVFLSHAAKLSGMLWQSNPIQPERRSGNRKSGRHTPERFRKLGITRRTKWGLGETHILNDKRFGAYHRRDDETAPAERSLRDDDCIIGHASSMTYRQRDEICQYDPLARHYSFYGETYQIHDMAAAIYVLLFYAKNEFKKQTTSIIDRTRPELRNAGNMC